MRIDLTDETEIPIHQALFNAIDPEEEFDCTFCRFYKESPNYDEFGYELEPDRTCINRNYLLCESVNRKMKEAMKEINEARKSKGMKVSELFI
ncbi:MAG: hypothetical protein V4629_03280 [Pseudomonadota bacterium]